MAASAVLTRRELPRVHGLLQELLRVVLPELAHMRVRVDDGVLQLAADALDLADVDVLRHPHRSEEQRLNSSHQISSYAVFCLKKKKYAVSRQRCVGRM